MKTSTYMIICAVYYSAMLIMYMQYCCKLPSLDYRTSSKVFIINKISNNKLNPA